MKEHKTDRRVRYTKMVIENSLIELLKIKKLAKITVKEICDLAEINRATFYAHYTDPYALLKSIEDNCTTRITHFLYSGFIGDNNSFQQKIKMVLEFIKENHVLIEILLGENADGSYQNQIIQILEKECYNNMISYGYSITDEIEYIYAYQTVGCVGVIKKWLKDGMNRSPDNMAELICQLSHKS